MLKQITKDKRAMTVCICVVFMVIIGITVVSIINSKSVVELSEELLVINENGVLTGIESNQERPYSLTVPDNVVKIASNAFEGDENLVSVKCDGALQSVGANAFSNCVNLKKVDISNYNSLLKIGFEAFSECISLESVNFSKCIPSFGDYVFKGCVSITEFEFFEKNFSIGMFLGCTGLENVKFYEEQNEVPERIFEGCNSLKTVYLPDTVEIIGKSAFKNCVSLESMELPDSIRIIDRGAFEGCVSLKNMEIPESATALYEAFNGCEQLTETENGITYVDGWAVSISAGTKNVIFREGTIGVAFGMECSQVKTVCIPSSVKYFGDSFRESQALTNVVFEDNSSLDSLYPYAFLNCTALETVDFGENSSLVDLGWMSFKGCTALKSIRIPCSIERFGNSFDECIALERIEFDGNDCLTVIGEEALSGLSALREFIIPDGVVIIGSNCFENCVSLEKVIIPSSVTAIGENMLRGCDNLKSIEIVDPDGWSLLDGEGNKIYDISADDLSDPEDAVEWFKAYSEGEYSLKKEA